MPKLTQKAAAPKAKKPTAPKLSQKRLRALGSAWTLDAKGKTLVGTFPFTRYLDAFMFATRVTVYAEVQRHYPEICITREQVRVILSTPTIGFVTEDDLEMAERINRIISTRT